MKTFFRWATALVAIIIVIAAAVYFLWMRDSGLGFGIAIPSVFQRTAQTIIPPGPPPGVETPVVENGAVTPVADAPEPDEPSDGNEANGNEADISEADISEGDNGQPIITPESPRQSVVIVPPTPEETAVVPAEPSEQEPAQSEATQPEAAQTPFHSQPSAQADSTFDPTVEQPSHGAAMMTPIPDSQPTQLAQSMPLGTPAPGDDAAWLVPAPVQVPESLAFGIATPERRAEIIVEPVVTAIVLSELLPTPTPQMPLTTQPLTTPVQLYRAPEAQAILADADAPLNTLDIVARDTTGNWYLLLNGLWVRAETIPNPPSQLPLVVPTVTPTPTNTGVPTPTDEPPAPTPAPPTPTPTPTSLDFPVCDCTPETYACVTHFFRVRAEAQACFEYCFRITGRDVHNLDGDGNGRACENLPE